MQLEKTMSERSAQISQRELLIRELHNKPDTLGLWNFPRFEDQQHLDVIIVQTDQNRGEKITVFPSGEVRKTPGNFQIRRLTRGYPIRQLVFKPEGDTEEFVLEDREF